MATGKKHYINLEADSDPEEYVKVVFTNLVKKQKNDISNEQSSSYPVAQLAGQVQKGLSEANNYNNTAKFDPVAVIVNGKVYYFNLASLKEKEPSNNLLNIHSGEIKKRVNKGNHLIEYMEQVPDFNLVIDYINDYGLSNISKVFNTDYARVNNFRMLLTKLSMTNLISKLDTLYPLLNVNGIMQLVSSEFISKLEPNNNLLHLKYWIGTGAVYYHFRDRELFNEYFRDYLLGKKSRADTAEHINKLQSITSSMSITDNRSVNNYYILAKIKNDLEYYGFNELQKLVGF